MMQGAPYRARQMRLRAASSTALHVLTAARTDIDVAAGVGSVGRFMYGGTECSRWPRIESVVMTAAVAFVSMFFAALRTRRSGRRWQWLGTEGWGVWGMAPSAWWPCEWGQ